MMVPWDFSLIINRSPHGAGLFDHRVIPCTPGHVHQLTSSDWQVGWFVLLFDPVSVWRHGNWTHGARFMIRKKSHCTIFTIDSRNQESVQVPTMTNVEPSHDVRHRRDTSRWVSRYHTISGRFDDYPSVELSVDWDLHGHPFSGSTPLRLTLIHP